jgi:hypothetical protein
MKPKARHSPQADRLRPEDQPQSLLADIALHGLRLGAPGHSGAFSRYEGRGRLGRRFGDCHAPRQILNAIFDGHRLAREFDSPHPQYPLPFIRERQVWGHETFPKRGDARPGVELS